MVEGWEVSVLCTLGKYSPHQGFYFRCCLGVEEVEGKEVGGAGEVGDKKLDGVEEG